MRHAAAVLCKFVPVMCSYWSLSLPCASRLLWGMAGQSNALAVAQGLGFSGEVLREARAIAADMRAVTDTQPRNETLAVSLEEQLHESQARLLFVITAQLTCRSDLRLVCRHAGNDCCEQTCADCDGARSWRQAPRHTICRLEIGWPCM